MTANYVLLEKITVGAAGAASVTFSGIPQTGYTDLVVRFSARSDRSGNATAPLRLYPNGSSTGITLRFVQGDGSAASSGTQSAFSAYIAEIPGSTATASTFGTNEIYIPNYTSSNYKSVSAESATENNATLAIAQMFAYLWSDTAAITSLQILDGLGNFVQHSTFYLYGVAKLGTTPAISPYATGGDTIMTDGTYWYHTFVSSGTFTPAKALTANYLVVAGGAGGGYQQGGGGGAGGLRSTVTATGGGGSLESALSLSTTGYTVTIGAGGAGGGVTQNGTNGSNSVFSTITSTGGGGGAYGGNSNPSSGGSGGGTNVAGGSGGAGTTNQGFAGGTTSAGRGSGGGGAGAVGVNSTSYTVAGNGGAGVATSISGSSVIYAGGGGGGMFSTGTAGTGGSGGGGNGGNNTTNATAGTANLGAGGGGGGQLGPSDNGAAGGSGIVIVRYAV